MKPSLRKLFRQIVFIVWAVGFALLLGWIVLDFKPIATSMKTIYTFSAIALIIYLALGTADDKI